MAIIMQTGGRCVRIGKGDRNGRYAKNKNMRMKKFGLCSFIIYEDDNTTEDKLREYFIKYYMLDNIKFEKNYSIQSSGNDMIGHKIAFRNSKKFTFDNIKFIIDFNDYITKDAKKIKRALRTSSVNEVINRMDIIDELNKDNTSKIFDNRQIIKIITDRVFDLK